MTESKKISREHYFDWAATSPSDEEIIRKALDISLEHWGNPSSIHEAGTDAKKALTEARKIAAEALGVKDSTIFFTSGGTESDHIPLLSMLTRPNQGSIILSAIEHPAMREMAKAMENCGWKIITVSPDKNGFITPESIVEKIQDDTTFVSVMAVNNETGAVQPYAEIAKSIEEACKGKRKPLFHVDCVQGAGKIPLDLSKVDAASVSAHKIGGPRGAGLLYLSRQITPFLRGGGQEGGIRSGTENLFGATALAMCLRKYAISERNPDAMKRFKDQEEMTQRFVESLKEIPGCKIIPHGRMEDPGLNFSPWIVQAAFPGIPGQVMERALSEQGFYISTGSACSSGKQSRPVLDSMNVSREEKESSVRFSFGSSITEKAMGELLEKVREIAARFAH